MRLVHVTFSFFLPWIPLLPWIAKGDVARFSSITYLVNMNGDAPAWNPQVGVKRVPKENRPTGILLSDFPSFLMKAFSQRWTINNSDNKQKKNETFADFIAQISKGRATFNARCVSASSLNRECTHA